MALTLYRFDLRNCVLFVLSWAIPLLKIVFYPWNVEVVCISV